MTHNLPIPAGAVAGDWYHAGGCGHPDDVSRRLTWSQHDVCEVHIAVDGAQYPDGRVERHITVYPYNSSDLELDAAGARRLAAALLDAADSLDALR